MWSLEVNQFETRVWTRSPTLMGEGCGTQSGLCPFGSSLNEVSLILKEKATSAVQCCRWQR